jgi:hypothetical protein
MVCVTRSIQGALSFFLVLASSTVLADWTSISSDKDIYSAYADKESIRRQGEMARMQGLYDFRRQDFTPDGKALFSTVVLREYDCGKRQVRLLSAIDFSGHMGEGNPVSSSATPRRWEAVVPGGLDELYWNVACGRK